MFRLYEKEGNSLDYYLSKGVLKIRTSFHPRRTKMADKSFIAVFLFDTIRHQCLSTQFIIHRAFRAVSPFITGLGPFPITSLHRRYTFLLLINLSADRLEERGFNDSQIVPGGPNYDNGVSRIYNRARLTLNRSRNRAALRPLQDSISIQTIQAELNYLILTYNIFYIK